MFCIYTWFEFGFCLFCLRWVLLIAIDCFAGSDWYVINSVVTLFLMVWVV